MALTFVQTPTRVSDSIAEQPLENQLSEYKQTQLGLFNNFVDAWGSDEIYVENEHVVKAFMTIAPNKVFDTYTIEVENKPQPEPPKNFIVVQLPPKHDLSHRAPDKNAETCGLSALCSAGGRQIDSAPVWFDMPVLSGKKISSVRRSARIAKKYHKR